jgi:hypothetical protein
VTLTWRPQPVPDTALSGDQIDHISQQKLLESLSGLYVLTANENGHLSGCDDCRRSLEVLRNLREGRFQTSARTSQQHPTDPDQAFTISTDFKSDTAS